MTANQAIRRVLSPFSEGISFIARQHHDWRVTVARTSLDRLTYQIVFPYQSIYIMALGASATQLGAVNSTGMAVAGLFGPLTGWLIDRLGAKRIYLIGISLRMLSYLQYGLAQNWLATIPAMMSYWLGYSTSVLGCATICGNCLANQDRARGMMFCETVAAGVLGMLGPMLGAWIVGLSGGVGVSGIRPLYIVGLLASCGTFFLVLTQLSDRRWRVIGTSARPNLFQDLQQVFKEGRNLKRWIVIGSICQLPLGMVLPFAQVFAHEFKGANQYMLGAMATGAALASIICAIPLGRLADRVGRKRVLYITLPLFWASNLLLLWAPSPTFLIAAGVLQGFFFIGAPIAAALERELVPAEQMGRWLGMMRFFRMLLNATLALVSGVVWDKLGPHYVFLSFIAIDMLVNVPLLIGMPETLRLKLEGRAA
jgi:MFS family permease